MKKNSFVHIASVFAILLVLGGSLTYLIRSQELTVAQHHEVILFFAQNNGAVNDLHEEVLRSRAFMSKNYDSVVKIGESMRANCNKFSAFSIWDASVLKAYCDLTEKKLQHVEKFKSRNSVLKNSLDYLPELVSQLRGANQNQAREFFSHLQRYSLVPSDELRSSILKKAALLPRSEAMNSLRLHAQNVVKSVQERHELETEILSHDLEDALDQLRAAYLKKHSGEQNKARLVKLILILFCGLMGLSLLVLFYRIQSIRNMLAAANEKLEEVAKLRTVELELALQELSEKQQQLAHSSKLSALGEMAGGVAHEINNPLAVICMRAEQLEESVRENEATPELMLESLAMIRKTSERIAKIVVGLRTFARDESAQATQPVKIASFVEDTLSLCQERFKSHGVSLIITRSADFDAIVEGRAVELSQVLLNLLNNAFDAIAPFQEKWIKLTVKSMNGRVEIAVTDSGHGIPESIREKITLPFFTTKEVGKGTGLGLSISKGILAAHRGELKLDAACPNTRFVMILPLAEKDEKKAA